MTEMDQLPPAAEISSVAQWKKSGEAPVPLMVPSGNTCLARAPGMQHFVKAGLVPASLMPIIYKAMKTGTPPDLKKIENDGEKINDMITMMNNVVCQVVVQPRVVPVPPEEDPDHEKYDENFERDDDLLYVDEVDPEDRMFIFQWACGGTSDLEAFRKRAEESLGSPRGRENVQRPAKRASRPRPKKS
jgi:hypothetical protein